MLEVSAKTLRMVENPRNGRNTDSKASTIAEVCDHPQGY